jgi:hypothetical protein
MILSCAVTFSVVTTGVGDPPRPERVSPLGMREPVVLRDPAVLRDPGVLRDVPGVLRDPGVPRDVPDVLLEGVGAGRTVGLLGRRKIRVAPPTASPGSRPPPA